MNGHDRPRYLCYCQPGTARCDDPYNWCDRAEQEDASELREAIAKALFLAGTPLEPIGAGRAYDLADAVLALPEIAALHAKTADRRAQRYDGYLATEETR